MLEFIKKSDESLCCGCKACEQICPKNAIELTPNDEGFFYPELNKEKCIHCRLCEEICPMMNKPLENEIKDIYAVQINDQKVLLNSSSGGAFRLLADTVIEKGGYVVGCIWGQGYRPVLEIACSKSQLLPMQGSKYLASDTNNIYMRVEKLLKSDELVLFTGTPCQCAGLINYLRRDYENLLVADFLCHGVPSQKAFDAYIKQIYKKNKIKDIDTAEYKFRDKTKMGWGIVSSYSWKKGKKKYKKYFVGLIDSYDYAFTQGYLNRYSCYSCPFRGKERCSDFTFSDFWGYDRFYDDLDISKGLSALSINTDKAEEIKNKLINKARIRKTTVEHVAIENPAILECTEDKIPEIRKSIYIEIEKTGWERTARKYFRCNNWFLRKIWYMIPTPVMRIIKKLCLNDKSRVIA